MSNNSMKIMDSLVNLLENVFLFFFFYSFNFQTNSISSSHFILKIIILLNILVLEEEREHIILQIEIKNRDQYQFLCVIILVHSYFNRRWLYNASDSEKYFLKLKRTELVEFFIENFCDFFFVG